MIIHSSLSHFNNPFSNDTVISFFMLGPVLKCQVTQIGVHLIPCPPGSAQSGGEHGTLDKQLLLRMTMGIKGHRDVEGEFSGRNSVRGHVVHVEA